VHLGKKKTSKSSRGYLSTVEAKRAVNREELVVVNQRVSLTALVRGTRALPMISWGVGLTRNSTTKSGGQVHGAYKNVAAKTRA